MTAREPILFSLLAGLTARGSTVALCRVCVQVLPIDRAAIVLRSDADGLELLCASDDVASEIEAVQITVGEGPGVEAIKVGGPVSVADPSPTGFGRWPAFVNALRGDVPGAMIALPLQVGAIRLGVLDLYIDDSRPLSKTELSDAVEVARALTIMLLAGPQGLGPGTADAQGNARPWWDQSPDSRVVHQASGMVVAQLGVPVREAYVRMQAYAFANDLLITEVAEAVVARRLRFDADEDWVH